MRAVAVLFVAAVGLAGVASAPANLAGAADVPQQADTVAPDQPNGGSGEPPVVETIDVVMTTDGSNLEVVQVRPTPPLPEELAATLDEVRVVEPSVAVVIDTEGGFSVVGAEIDRTPILVDQFSVDGEVSGRIVDAPTDTVIVTVPAEAPAQTVSVQLAPGVIASTDVPAAPNDGGEEPPDDAAQGDDPSDVNDLDPGSEGGDDGDGEDARQAWPSTTIHEGGPSDQAVDIVILGDGYTLAELDDFADDALEAAQHLLEEAPFSGLQRYVNIHRVDVPSFESGTDDVCAGSFVDTAFDVGFNPTGIDCRLLWGSNPAAVYQAAESAPAVDTVAVLVNTTRYGGAARPGGIAYTSTGIDGPEIFAHEFGHSFGFLGDEYSGIGPAPAYLGDFPNISLDPVNEPLEWADWVHPATPLPTLGATPGVPGAYEGAGGYEFGAFRPTPQSKMRALYHDFEIVNADVLARRILAYAPFDDTLPDVEAVVTGRSDNSVDVRVTFSDLESSVAGAAASRLGTFIDTALVPAGFVESGVTTLTIDTAGEGLPEVVYARVRNAAGVESMVEVPVLPPSIDRGIIDLALESVRLFPVDSGEADAANQFQIGVLILNRGSAPTPAGFAHVVHVRSMDDLVVKLPAHTESIEPGGSAFLLSEPLELDSLSEPLLAVVDPDDLIPGERRERNNARSFPPTIAIAQQPAEQADGETPVD